MTVKLSNCETLRIKLGVSNEIKTIIRSSKIKGINYLIAGSTDGIFPTQTFFFALQVINIKYATGHK